MKRKAASIIRGRGNILVMSPIIMRAPIYRISLAVQEPIDSTRSSFQRSINLVATNHHQQQAKSTSPSQRTHNLYEVCASAPWYSVFMAENLPLTDGRRPSGCTQVSNDCSQTTAAQSQSNVRFCSSTPSTTTHRLPARCF